MAIRLGTIYGIPILLDYSWFIIFFLIAYTVGFGLMPTSYPGLGWVEYLSIGMLSSIFLFASVLIHELAHSLLAKRNGLAIKQITLFIFGGVSEIEEEAPSPSVELKVSAAGPLTSAVISAIAYLGLHATVSLGLPSLIRAPLEYTGFVNAIIAAFNLIPAFPMDGGRILRSLLWSRSKDMMNATRKASNVGRGFAFAMMFVGIFFVFTNDPITGLWLVLIGWFISSAAQSAMAQSTIEKDLAPLKANQVMTRTVDSVPPGITIEELSQEFFRTKHNGFPVISGEELVGCVAAQDLRKIKRDLWGATMVSEIMIPREKLVTMKESDEAAKAFSLMNRNRIGRIFVVNDSGKLVGIITRSDIIKVVQTQERTRGLRYAGYGIGANGRTMTVQEHMLFDLEQPVQPEHDWTADFDPGAFALVRERLIRSLDGAESKEFTFEALRRGSFNITLILKIRSVEGTQQQTDQSRKSVKYTIMVS